MSIIQGNAHTSAGGGGFQIERSLRFNSADSAYLNRTFTTPTDGKRWTWSGWVKRGILTNGTGTAQQLFSAGSATALFRFSTTDTLVSGWTGAANLETTQVFRDASAWYHIMLVVDTTQATASNRVKYYVNGSQITAFSSTDYPTQNSTTTINSAVAHNIGAYTSSTQYFNGYLTEVNFIDGQALTPSSFGETDSATGVWKPKAYTGTYGTNGFYLPFKTASQWSGYFDGSGDYLSFNGSTGTTLSGDFTVESWVYLPSVTTTAPIMCIGDSFSSPGILFYVNSSSKIAIARANTVAFTGSTSLVANTWNHVAFVRSGSTITGYLNGVSQGTFTNSSTFSGTTTVIGREVYNSGVGAQLTGYISNLRIVNGTAVYTGAFTPPTSQLTAITNTSLLTCQSSTFVDNSTNAFTITTNGDSRPQQFSPFTLDVTDDHSGQGNHWQPNNLDLRTTGVGADILVDSPTSYGTDTGVGGEVRGNYCTMNPLDSKNGTASNGNLLWTATASQSDIRGTFAIPASGKWYMECTVGSTTNASSAVSFGLATSSVALDASNAVTGLYQLYASSSGFLSLNGTNVSSSLGAWTAGDVLQIAVDVDNTKMWLGKNNTWYNSTGGTTGNPSTGANATSTTSMVGLFPFSNCYQNNATWNAGQRAFAYTAPSGFKALCTQNLPTPTIGATSTTQANDYFNPVLYTGNGTSSNAITGVGFQPDFVWIKPRSLADHHRLTDAVRGVRKTLKTNLTDAESSNTANDLLYTFDSDGFTIGGSDSGWNGSGSTYVSWNWKANGAGSSNTAGTITSTVSANTTSGFSIVTYVGTNAIGATVGHGLGAAPAMIIIKNRSSAEAWPVYHTSIGATKYLVLNTTAAAATATTPWNNTAPTSTVFTIANWNALNENGSNHVAYCFAPVAGYSSFGSYTGNGSADGPFVYTGFRPRYVLIKASSTGGAGYDWFIHDTARDTYNVCTLDLEANLNLSENQYGAEQDILSNGFKLRNTGGGTNGSGVTYIYAAFAETPAKFSLAR